MATQANIGRWKFRKATTGSPATFNDLEEVYEIGGIGVSGETMDVTNFDSPPGYKEFIPGLKEGEEVTVSCRFIPAATHQNAMRAAVETGTNIQFQVAYVGVSPEKTWTFAGSPLGYTEGPSATEANSVTFRVKISGDISRA